MKRLHRAAINASELRAIFVLMVVLALRAYRFIQSIWHAAPTIIEVVEYIQRRFNVRLSYYLYQAHWLGNK